MQRSAATSGGARDVDPFDLPDWLGSGRVDLEPDQGIRVGHLVPGLLTGVAGDRLPCDLFAVDEAYPTPVTDDDTRTRSHQAWRHGQVLLLSYDEPADARRARPGVRRQPGPRRPRPAGPGGRCDARRLRGAAPARHAIVLDRVRPCPRSRCSPNPTAGKGRGAKARAIALPRLRDAGFVVRDLQGADAGEALALARQCVADGVESLVVCGGDGMVAPGRPGPRRHADQARPDPGGHRQRRGPLPRHPAQGPRRRGRRGHGGPDPHDRPGPQRVDVLRHRAGGRLRRHRQRARQRDDLAARPDALQPGHPRRAAHLQAPRATPSSWTA